MFWRELFLCLGNNFVQKFEMLVVLQCLNQQGVEFTKREFCIDSQPVEQAEHLSHTTHHEN